MKKLYFLFILPLFLVSIISAQSWDWGRKGSGSVKSTSDGSQVAIDGAGNAYITGQYEISINFGNITLTNNSGNIVYLAKYDPSGNIIWAVQPTPVGLNSPSFSASVTTNRLREIYITGYFSDTLIFGNDTLRTSSTGTSVFLVKYNSLGKVLWAKQGIIPNINLPSSQSTVVTADTSNNILITGTFQGSITFGAYTLTNTGNPTVFLVKYDSSGNVLWAQQSITALYGGSCTRTSVITDSWNNIYITGNFSSGISFGPYKLSSPGSISAFITRYSASGNVLWARQSDNYSNGEASPNSIGKDGKSFIYIAGNFFDSVKFGTHSIYAPTDGAFLVKYDSGGNAIWAQQSSAGMTANSVSSDGIDHIYVGGATSSHRSYTFGKFTLYATHKADTVNAFLLKFDTGGNALCGSLLEDSWYGPQPVGVAADSISPSGIYIYMAGTFGANDTVICGPDTLTAPNPQSTIFIGRWSDCSQQITTGISEVKADPDSYRDEKVKVYPNPSNGVLTFALSHPELAGPDEPFGRVSESQTIEVYNMLGEKVYSNQFLISNSPFQINLSNQPNGIYLYRVLNEDRSLIGEEKIIIAK